MHKAIDFQIRSIAPLLMHNGQLADPLNEYSRSLKKVSGKKTKTDADHAEMADIEWEGGLYLNAEGAPCFPGENLEAAMVKGGKKFKLGEACKAGILCDGDWPLIYRGPKTLDKLRDDAAFRDRRKVNINNRSIMRTRPVFQSWSLEFTVHYLPDLLNEKQIVDIIECVGRIIGIGDYVPKYGRFLVESAKPKK